MAVSNVTEKQQKSHFFRSVFIIEIFVTTAKVNIPSKLQS